MAELNFVAYSIFVYFNSIKVYIIIVFSIIMRLSESG